MLTAKVVDNIWSTRKTDLLNGYKLMLVEVIGGRDDGQRVVAIDRRLRVLTSRRGKDEFA